jgi:hypothetical protein
MEEVVLVSPRMALMKSGMAAQEWERVLTAQAKSDPSGAITMVRFRASRNEGRPWVKPGVLDALLKRGRAKAAAARLPEKQALLATLKADIVIQGVVVGDQEHLIGKIMEKINIQSGLRLTRRTSTTRMQGNEWEPNLGADGVWRGRISCQAADKKDIEKLFDKVHGHGIELDGICLVLEVESHFVERKAIKPDIGMGMGPEQANEARV